MGDTRPVRDRLDQGHAALSEGAWETARSIFAELLEAGDDPEALEGYSWAAWWLDDVTGCLETRERAYRAYRRRGDLAGAARMALWIGDDHLEFRGDPAVANGWFQRAARLLDGLAACAEHGWLAAFQAHWAVTANDTATARRLAAQARELGRRHGVVDIEMLALATEGVAMVDDGEIEAGMARLDEAAAAALAGEYQSLAPAGWTCCHLISACDRVRDVPRAIQWCQKVEEFSRRLRVRFVHGACRAHYGAVLAWHGDWDDAERELVAATADLTGRRPFWRSEALVRLADLRRRQGRVDEAAALFADAEPHPLARLGLAELALGHGDPDTARDLAERLLRRIPPTNRVRRAAPLELLVRAAVAGGDHAAATAAVAELEAIAGAVGTPPLRGAASFAGGVVAAAAGDHDTARERFGDAVELFAAGAAPFEMGEARLALAAALAALGRTQAAAHEAAAARRRFDEIGAGAERDRADRLLQELGAAAPLPAAGPLTPRQVEVLRLVAEGLTDREIAERLVLSEHTVHRHIANIHTRLGRSTRAAAVAEAGRRGLL
jgi:LuxR family transcriptional regulator, maltose regulon positive regulatory protein